MDDIKEQLAQLGELTLRQADILTPDEPADLEGRLCKLGLADLLPAIACVIKPTEFRAMNAEHAVKYLREENEHMRKQMDFFLARDKLDEGLLPEMKSISLLEVQIWDNGWEKLNPDQVKNERSAGHGPQSARLTASINGRRFGGKAEINVALSDGETFAAQVSEFKGDVPHELRNVSRVRFGK